MKRILICRACWRRAVACQDTTTKFADHGDSGALVIGYNKRRPEDPIAVGIIASGGAIHTSPPSFTGVYPMYVTYVIPLKNCFHIAQRDLDMDLALCEKWQICPMKSVA